MPDAAPMATLVPDNPNVLFTAAIDVCPVPPFATGTTPVTFAAEPGIFPITLDPEIVAIFASVTFASRILAVVIALAATTGAAAVPLKSPAN